MTGLLALTASAASSRAQNVAGANPLGKSGSLSRDLAYALAIQRDGRLVVAGRSAYGGWRFALARYTAGGKLDPSFGGDGKVVTAFGSRGYSWTSALAIQRDGKLVAAGRSRVTALSDDSAVGRYSARGRLDSSFGRGGKVLTDFGSRKRVSGWANAVAIQADGKLVVAGSSGIIADGPWRFALSRYTARGKLDPTFGSGGKVLTRFGPVSDSAVAVAIQRDGKIVAAGSDVRNHAVFALARYTPGGKLDPSFGSGGKVLNRPRIVERRPRRRDPGRRQARRRRRGPVVRLRGRPLRRRREARLELRKRRQGHDQLPHRQVVGSRRPHTGFDLSPRPRVPA